MPRRMARRVISPFPARGQRYHRLPHPCDGRWAGVNTSSVKGAALRAVPGALRPQIRRVLRRSQPWDPGAKLQPPACPPGMRVGPPDFVGVGAQKAGTSWWFDLLLRHPGTYHPRAVHKERHYFARYWSEPYGEADSRNYHRWFPRPEGQLTGEWTPAYMAQFWVPALLAQAAPDAKVLVMLRDPVERYRSGLTHADDRGQDEDPKVATDALHRGFYAAQLAWLRSRVGADRILVQQYERCRTQPADELARTYRFVGLDDGFVPETFTEQMNPTRGMKKPLDDRRRDELVELYAADVGALVRDYPELDLSLWPNFAERVP